LIRFPSEELSVCSGRTRRHLYRLLQSTDLKPYVLPQPIADRERNLRDGPGFEAGRDRRDAVASDRQQRHGIVSATVAERVVVSSGREVVNGNLHARQDAARHIRNSSQNIGRRLLSDQLCRQQRENTGQGDPSGAVQIRHSTLLCPATYSSGSSAGDARLRI